MENGKAVESSQITTNIGVRMVNDLINTVVRDRTVLCDCLMSVIMNVYKGKADAL